MIRCRDKVRDGEGTWVWAEDRLASQIQAWIPENPVPSPSCTSFPPHSGSFKELKGAAFSPNSFNCFSNLKTKAQQGNLREVPASERGPRALCPTQGADSGTRIPPFSSATPSSTLQAGELPGCCQAGESSPILMRRLGPGCPKPFSLALGYTPGVLTLNTAWRENCRGNRGGGDRGWVLPG